MLVSLFELPSSQGRPDTHIACWEGADLAAFIITDLVGTWRQFRVENLDRVKEIVAHLECHAWLTVKSFERAISTFPEEPMPTDTELISAIVSKQHAKNPGCRGQNKGFGG